MIFTTVLAAFGVVAMPGPTNAVVAVRATRPNLPEALAGVPVALAAYATSTSVLLAAGLLLGDVGKLAGLALKVAIIAYLLFLAFRLWTRGGAAVAAAPSVSLREILLTTLLNPKALLFAVLIRGGPDWTGHLLETATGCLLAGLAGLSIWFALGRIGGAALGDKAARYTSRVAAVIVVVAAGLLAFK